jgi:DAPG hydrolase PhiG domain
MPSRHPQAQHLGYSASELANSPYARFFKTDVPPLAAHVKEALLVGAQPCELFPDVKLAGLLLEPGYWPMETGYGIGPDGSVQVFVLTEMTGVTPAMWDWWFAWHGSEAQRYKLWHPSAHVHAVWADGRADLQHYVGRVSKVVEYVGPERLDLNIRFVSPASLGLDETRLQQQGEVAICAKGGMAGTPVETGWLVHHLRPVAGGCEMRSRFWLGGRHVQLRGGSGWMASLVARAAAYCNPMRAQQGAELLVHCAQEMSHLATLLPELYQEFGPQKH